MHIIQRRVPMREVSGARHRWAIAGSIATVITLAWSIVTTVWAGDGTEPISVFLQSDDGGPRTDVIALFPDGQQLEPDRNGLLSIPLPRQGQQVSIRDQESRAELTSFYVPNRSPEVFRVDVP
jgi:hypothetical protein